MKQTKTSETNGVLDAPNLPTLGHYRPAKDGVGSPTWERFPAEKCAADDDAEMVRFLALNPVETTFTVYARNLYCNGSDCSGEVMVGTRAQCDVFLTELLQSYLRFGWCIDYSPAPDSRLTVTMKVEKCTPSASNSRVINFYVLPSL